MRKFLVLAISCSLMTPAVLADEGHKHVDKADGKTVTVAGEIVDLACYLNHEGKGEKHKKCAQTCLLEGAPMGLLSSDGSVLLLVEDHSKKKVYDSVKRKGGEKMRVAGRLVSKGGIKAMVVDSAEASK